MADPNPVPFQYAPPPSGGVKIPILFGAVIALAAANVYLFLQLDRTRTDLAKTREALSTEIANVRDSTSVTGQTNKRHTESVRDELETVRRQASMAAGQAKEEALKKAEELAAKLAAEQKRAEQQVASQFNAVKTDLQNSTAATQTKFGEVSTEIGAVKSDLGSTKQELDKTISDLKRTNGDLGVQSGLIATNGKELAALKAPGERNYFEFYLGKTKQPQKIGDISVLLKKVDTKKNKYTIEVLADDKTVEKRDKNLNEPVQFYTSKARQPYELVVNQVKKDNIVGYLAVPKVQTSRN